MFKCPHCDQKYAENPKLAGKTLKCKKCGQDVPVPARQTAMVPPAEPEWEERPDATSPVEAYGWGGPLPVQPVAAPPKRVQPSGMADFFLFRRMITPVIICAIYWLFAGVMLVLGVIQAGVGVYRLSTGTAADMVPFVASVGCLFSILVGRIVCETVILFFRMNETLTDVCDELQHQDRA